MYIVQLRSAYNCTQNVRALSLDKKDDDDEHDRMDVGDDDEDGQTR